MAIPLDALLQRSARPKPHAKRPASAPIPIAIKLRDIERQSRLAIPHDPETPRALVLVILETRCLNCERLYTAPNQHCLVRYDNHGLSNSMKYTKIDVMPFVGLPREHKVIRQTTPFCMECF